MAQPTKLIVCPTSHMDWDWISSFEQYYKLNSDNDTRAVQSILDAALALFESEQSFLFSVAESGWLQRYLVDQVGTLPSAPQLPQTLRLLGGAITSPDNLVCDGEVFVRTYLVGRQWAQSVGLAAAVENVAWMPDDFGHDPELPIILAAMGLAAVGFARVPGAFPLYAVPLDSSPSLACSLMAEGVAFYWQASDGSVVFAHFMPDTYGVPSHSQGANGVINARAWIQFVQSAFLTNYFCPHRSAVVWPGGVAFAPAGGDFALPDSGWVNGVACFNQQQSDTFATIGSFPDYVSAASGANLQTLPIDPSNFYTGYFGSRPELKRLQARASRNLVAAETVSSLLRLGAGVSSAALDALDGAISQVWRILAPSSHHDFVTGTSPDSTYKMEQLSMLSLAAHLARTIYQQALQIIADAIKPSDAGTDTVVAVHNPVGVARSGVFKLECGAAVNFEGSGAATVQPLAGGGLLVQSPVAPSLGYVSGMVTFGQRPAPPQPVAAGDEVTIDNGSLSITLSRSRLWAITSIVPSGGANVLPSGAAANLLQVYEDDGNLYQYGNEPLDHKRDGTETFGTFAAKAGALSAGAARQTEFGPLRWRVEAELTGTGGTAYLLVYTVITGESLIRMRVTGSAPSGTTVVTSFPARATDGVTQGTHLRYGTAHHFHKDAAPAYWTGPTFKATHNFLMPAADSPGATFALTAIYHDGMPAWACEHGTLLGSLFRNTPGTQRAANGSDKDTHTQDYALRISTTALDPAQGTPLVEALQVANPLRAALASIANEPESPMTLARSASLASTSLPALIRVARPMGQAPGAAGSELAQIALRLYRPDADGQETQVQVTMPVLAPASNVTAALVTALEQPISDAPSVTVSGDVLSVPSSFAVTTVAISAPRPTY